LAQRSLYQNQQHYMVSGASSVLSFYIVLVNYTEVNIKAATSFINVAAIFYISVNFLDFYNGKCFRMNDLRAVKRSEEISLRWLPA